MKWIAPILLLFLRTIVATRKENRPEVTHVRPASGSSAGGFRVQISGRNLALFPFQASVTLKSGLACKDVRVDRAWTKMSCTMPPCNGCGDTTLSVSVSGRATNSLPFHFVDECYDGSTPKLPRRYSAAENCVR